MDDLNEQKLLREGSDLDIVFSSSQFDAANAAGNDIKKLQVGNRWVIKSGTSLNLLSLVSLKLDEFNSNKILDIEIIKYLID